ncbi:hypothetical protein [Streptomyces aureus]|uniref:hypothetical protein n=1 Tax=Streptomyces aureus TaxID=193461 RepID=UPI000569B7FD|nr:hypothetical protein [Streptomyces aureus]
MITVQPVLEIPSHEPFGLWPVSDVEPFSFLALDGTLTPDGVGATVMALATCNDLDDEDDLPPRPDDPLGGFLHGLLTRDPLIASGGLRVTDTLTGTLLVPGCCSGLEDRGDWWDVLDGDGHAAWLGHDPSPRAERHGSAVRLTVDSATDTGRRIDVPVAELRRLLTAVEEDLADFLALAARWAEEHLPDHSERLGGALARALAPPPRN